MITETPISHDVFKQGMRLLAGGVCILATNSDGEWYGLTMTAVCSLTMEPPSLIACVSRGASANVMIGKTRRISINVLSDDHTGLAARFSSSDVKGPARFDPSQWTKMASGVPALNDALAVFDCEINQKTEFGQHSVLFCEVKNAHLQSNRKPLVHFNREFYGVLPVQQLSARDDSPLRDCRPSFNGSQLTRPVNAARDACGRCHLGWGLMPC